MIDDDQDDQEIFGIALEKIGIPINLVTANDAFEGLEKLNKEKTFIPDFIFLDLNMPLMNGRQCLAEMKKCPALSKIPVIIYSTSEEQKDIIETMAMGASGFITKPGSLHKLTIILSDFFQKNIVAHD